MSDRRRYRKPLVTFEFGTRIYAPSEAERRYRIISKNPSGGRIFQKFASEDEARARARQLEAMLAASVILPSRGSAPTTVAQLSELYAASLGSRSTRYAERQQSLLRHWVTPVIGDRPLVGWTPADSERVLDCARQRLAPATVQNVGACMRALVTFAYKNRWLARERDPMWLVRYSARADVQGHAVGFIPRASLPTDEDCQRLFDALESLNQPVWSLAMRLKHRSGARWGELIALRPADLDFEPHRVVRIHRAVEQSARGISIKTTKNRQQRVSTCPASLVADLRQRARDVDRAAGPEGLLFPGANGGFANRRIFQRIWIRCAQKADWPMRSPTSAAWHPHDLRHVAACWLLFDVGLDPAVVSALLGHANAAFTLSRYVGVRGDLISRVTTATDAW